ncbi:hypothetical protein T01_8754 [Trichinella spiralis]|uniref:Uncharacterized protein n=1 Tax=Trichinella spiralis TaxID=6334 RepID=A0A0V1APS9_TRISP|nr:hypothetical protein T01_8754 [Trichinella spiralis]
MFTNAPVGFVGYGYANHRLRWDFKVHIRSRSSSTPIGPLSLYRPLRESHRPQGVDIDHFGYPCLRESLRPRGVDIDHFGYPWPKLFID